MSQLMLEKRVSSLEEVLQEFITQTGRALMRLENEMRDFKDEMRATVLRLEVSDIEFKKEMKEFKEEMSEFKKEMRATVHRLEVSDIEFKKEMKEFKEEMSEFKKEMRATVHRLEISDLNMQKMIDDREKSDRQMRKQWGELAQKMGTVVEDIVAPNLPRVAGEHFGVDEILDFSLRRKRTKPGDRNNQREFDAIIVSNDKVILNETKSTARPEYIKEFIQFLKSGEFYQFFPEYSGKELIPVFSSIHLDLSVVNKLSKNKIYGMGMNDDTMDILNYGDF